MRTRGARELRPPPPAPARDPVKYVRPLAVKIRAAWRAFGRCAHLFFVVGMTSQPALPLSPGPPPSFKTRKNVASSRFRRDATPYLCRSLPPRPPPDPNATLEISSLSFSHSFPLVPLFLQNPITKDSFHRGERRDSWSGLSLTRHMHTFPLS